MQKKNYNSGLVIGRFQPFHLGHKFLLEEALKIAETIIIGIGSANKNDESNPWDFKEREKFVRAFIKQEGLDDKVVKIVPLFDNPDDEVWFNNLAKAVGVFDVTIGNNPWNNGIIERHGIPAIEVGFRNRDMWEGIKIRKLMFDKKDWQDRVPQYLVKKISSK